MDLALKVKEKGKNSIGLNGGVSGLAGAFIGLNYTTNNFLGLGETLQVQASIGNLKRDVLFGFTEPYLFGSSDAVRIHRIHHPAPATTRRGSTRFSAGSN